MHGGLGQPTGEVGHCQQSGAQPRRVVANSSNIEHAMMEAGDAASPCQTTQILDPAPLTSAWRDSLKHLTSLPECNWTTRSALRSDSSNSTSDSPKLLTPCNRSPPT